MDIEKTLTHAMQWRKSVKMFDAEKKVLQADVDDILDCSVLSPSSFGLEPWKFVVISDDDVKAQLGHAGYDQKQFTTASHIVVMCVHTAVDEGYVDEMVERVCTVRGVTLESLEEYSQMIKGMIRNKSKEEILQWSIHQVYLATGVLLSAAALKSIDASPMEGLDAKKFDEILDLEGSNYQTVMAVALGFRSSQDAYVAREKVRRSRDVVISEI